MKLIIFLTLLLSSSIFALTLKPGDVLLMSFNCYECRVIESETGSSFSHSGVILNDQLGNLKVVQSLLKVDFFDLNDFLKYKTPNTKISVYRPIEIDQKRSKILERKMTKIFMENYLGLKFDSKYLWDNVDASGKELLYCSEFVAKFLDNFISEKTVPYPLSYAKNYDYWFKYFKGVIPEGELGNSPASFSTDPRFKFVGFLE